jgi:peptide/nickel transport system permease protein
MIISTFHSFFIPGLFITFFVVGWNLLGDALRDVLDPQLRRR